MSETKGSKFNKRNSIGITFKGKTFPSEVAAITEILIEDSHSKTPHSFKDISFILSLASKRAVKIQSVSYAYHKAVIKGIIKPYYELLRTKGKRPEYLLGV